MNSEKQESSHEVVDASSETPTPEPIDPAIIQKANEILDACRRRDAGQLRSLAESKGGLINDKLRQQACTCNHRP